MSHLRPGPAARPAARRRPQPGARLRRPRALRDRPRLPRRRAGRAGAARHRPADRRHRAAQHATAPGGRSTSGTPAPTPRRRWRRIGAPPTLMLRRAAPAWFHPGRSGVLSLGPKTRARRLRRAAPAHPAGARRARAGGRLHAPARGAALPEGAAAPPGRRSRSPTCRPVERDFAFVLDDRVEAEAVLKAARAADKALIEAVSVFDVFAGPQGRGADGAGQEVAGDRRPAAADGRHADRGRDRGGLARASSPASRQATGGRLRT